MITAPTFSFENRKHDKMELAYKKQGKRAVLKKLHIEKVSDTGEFLPPDNLKITLTINSWPVLDRFSGKLLSSSPNTVVLNHEFETTDEIKVEIEEIVPTASTDKVNITPVLEYIEWNA